MSTQEMHIPPHNTQAEEGLLSACLNGYCPPEIFDILTGDNFYRTANKHIFNSIKNLFNLKQPIDLITVHANCVARGEAEAVGGKQELMRLLSDIPLSVNPVQYAKIIKAASIARQLCTIAQGIASDSYTITDLNIMEVLDSAQSAIMGVKFDTTEKACISFDDLCNKRLDDYEQMSHGKRQGLRTGFPTLDRLTGGLWGSKLVILAARPSIGKTAMMMNMAITMARNHHRVGIFELEMDAEELIDRAISSLTGINSIRLATGDMSTPEEWEKINIAAGKISEYRLDIDDTGGLSIHDLKRRARTMVKLGVEIIFIDQLSKIRGGKGKSEYEQRSYVVNELMALKKELKLPIVLLAQINRNADARETKKPMLSDLKSTGSLEEDSDIVLLGHRPHPYTRKEEDRTKATWEIAKHRGGLTWNIEMYWDAKTTTFTEILKAT